jgi:hypothetical protein
MTTPTAINAFLVSFLEGQVILLTSALTSLKNLSTPPLLGVFLVKFTFSLTAITSHP